MKEEAPLRNPFIGEPRGGRPEKMVAMRPTHVAKAPPFCPKGVVLELKREIVEERRKGGRGWPAGCHTRLLNQNWILIVSVPRN
jgi:hypothetical protein